MHGNAALRRTHLRHTIKVIRRPSRDTTERDLLGHAAPESHADAIEERLACVEGDLFREVLRKAQGALGAAAGAQGKTAGDAAELDHSKACGQHTHGIIVTLSNGSACAEDGRRRGHAQRSSSGSNNSRARETIQR